MASLKDIAVKSGFSISTVSRALNDSPLLSRETSDIIKGIAGELDYVPNVQARTLAGGAARIIGFMTSQIRNTYDLAVLKGVEDAAKQHGYSVLICLYYNDANRTQAYQRLMNQPFFDGIIVGFSAGQWRWDFTKKPVAYVDQWPSQSIHDIIVVTSDHDQYARLFVDFFISNGVKKVLYFGNGSSNPVETARFDAITSACRTADLPLKQVAPGLDNLKPFLRDTQDSGAEWGIIQEPTWCDIRTAEDAGPFLSKAVAGYSDIADISGLKGSFRHAISILQDHEAMGKSAFEQLLHRITKKSVSGRFHFTHVTSISF